MTGMDPTLARTPTPAASAPTAGPNDAAVLQTASLPRATPPSAGLPSAGLPSAGLPSARPRSSILPSRSRRFLHALVTRGWIHVALLTCVGIFLFPFAYMFATSLKTDDELLETGWLPAIPQFEGISPRVKPTPAVSKPGEAPQETWDAVLPQLRQITRAAVDAYVAKHGAAGHAGAESVDANEYRAAATEMLVSRIVARLNVDLWVLRTAVVPTAVVPTAVVPAAGTEGGAGGELISAYKIALTHDMIAAALDDRLARLELRGLQARSLDGHIYSIAPGNTVSTTWRIEQGDASFIPAKDSAVLKYQFKSPTDTPIVLRCDFDYPADPTQLHKLILALKPDDSWHRIDATLDLNGTHWVSQKTKYLGTTRNQSILFQPPSFDDTTNRKRIWVPLKANDEGGRKSESKDEGGRMKDEKEGSVPSSAALPSSGSSFILPPSSFSSPPSSLSSPASLRITISPSSTARAIWGKARRNYDRAFESVPFWRYVRNSLFVVVLATAGTLFSSSFVAYAFARLNWPGRSVAFAILLATMMLPSQVTMIPSFMIWRAAGLYNTLTPLWLPAWFGTAFFIFLMVQHMRTIPRELEEAARIDGAGPLRTWAQVILPETKPALAAIAIMTAMSAWNEFLAPLIYLRDQDKFPLSLGLYALRLDNPEGGIDWTAIMAGNVLMTLPVIVIFFLFQRYFIEGMSMSGMKG
jgi:multiple sugar transport system permease protein